MKKGKRNGRLSIRLSIDEQVKLEEVYRLSRSRGTISTFARNILLGHTEHPLAPIIPGHVLDVKDHGALNGSYDNRVHYQAVVIAAQYLAIQNDPVYAKVIKDNKKAFEKIIMQIRGYNFDDKTAVKLPLDRT